MNTIANCPICDSRCLISLDPGGDVFVECSSGHCRYNGPLSRNRELAIENHNTMAGEINKMVQKKILTELDLFLILLYKRLQYHVLGMPMEEDNESS